MANELPRKPRKVIVPPTTVCPRCGCEVPGIGDIPASFCNSCGLNLGADLSGDEEDDDNCVEELDFDNPSSVEYDVRYRDGY